jgi:nickel/cobalt transporter (NicO) family protein
LRALDPRARPTPQRLRRWAFTTAGGLAPLLSLQVDDGTRALRLDTADAGTRRGAAGLATILLHADYSAPIGAGPHRIAFRDGTQPARIGWRDVVGGDEREPTDGLRRYPPALLGSPRDRGNRAFVVEATGALRPLADDGAVPSPAGAAPSLARNDLLAALLVRDPTSPGIVLLALLLALGLGALHALEPGHGKTLLAVSLVGARATPRQALLLATALTLAHTAGVLILGVLVLSAARWIVPETIYPWLTLSCGLVVALLAARALAVQLHTYPHDRGHRHTHAHPHPHATAALSFRGALLAAMSGNLAPCPAALVVLLGSIALHRVGYGLALILAFGAGLALVLTGVGIAVVRGAAWLGARPRLQGLTRYGPLLTAAIMACVGAGIVAQGFAQEGIAAPPGVVAPLVLLAIAGYASTTHTHRHLHEASSTLPATGGRP